MPLACPSCHHALTVGNLLEAALSSVPGDGLVDFRCASCGERGLARLSDGLAEIGRATDDGFRVASFEIVSDLAIAQQPRVLRVWYRGRQKDVPRRAEVVRAPGTPPDRTAA